MTLEFYNPAFEPLAMGATVHPEKRRVALRVPFVVSKSPEMALFGGIDVDVSEADVAAIRDTLLRATD